MRVDGSSRFAVLSARTRPARARPGHLGQRLALASAAAALWAVVVSAPATAQRVHTVRPGETVAQIARHYHIPAAALTTVNAIADPKQLRPGDRLLIPRAVQVADGYPMPAARRAPGRPAPRTGGRNHRSQRPAARPAATQRPAARPATAVPTGDAPRIAPAPRTAALPADPKRRISINFDNVEARQALAAIADHSGVDVLITPGTRGTVSINLRSRTPDEAIRQVAAAAGLSVVKVGESYVVGPADEVRKATAELGSTEVMALRYAKPEDAKEVLARAVPTVSVETAAKSVIVSGLAQDLEAARSVVRQLDVAPPAAPVEPPKLETDVWALRHMSPDDAEKLIRQAFPQVKVTRHDRTLALTGTRADLAGVDRAIKALDVAPLQAAAPAAPQREVVVYRLKYLNAKHAEETLKSVVPGLTVAAAPEPAAPPAANFQPLSLGMMGGGTSTGGSGSFSFGTGGVLTTTSGGAVSSQERTRVTSLVLTGSPADLAMAQRILEQTDVPPPLVRIEAAIIEVNREAMKQLGIRWDFSQTGVTFTVPGGEGLNFGNIQMSDLTWRAALDALIVENQARLLANPNISVVDNEDASIFIGDLRRFRGIDVVSPDVGTVQGTVTIPVGIALLVRPRIHPDGGVTLKVHPVVSTVSDIIDGLPQTASREADTTVRLNRGESLVIGGLDREQRSNVVQRVPILSDIPVVGELFRSRSRRTQTTEVLVIIAAYPVVTEPAPPVEQFGRAAGGRLP